MISILFVCLGNICRSPLAEEVFREITRQHNKENLFHIDSCGVENYHMGEKPDVRMALTANLHGLKFNHFARQFKREDFNKFCFIVAMDQNNQRILKNLAETTLMKEKIYTLRTFDTLGNATMDVPDPYYGDQAGFEDVYQIVLRSCERFYSFISEKNLP